MKKLKIALAQINPTVGDLHGNSRKILEFYYSATRVNDVDLVVFPECSLTGYPPEDLLLRDDFIDANIHCLKALAKKIGTTQAIIGFVHRKGKNIYNSAALAGRSKVLNIYSKQSLPNYGVFDEKRYFLPGQNSGLMNIKGIPIGLTICEDIWKNEGQTNPALRQAKSGAKILINISASPYHAGKFNERLKLLKNKARQTACPIIYVNMVGGQDELVFDGRSMVLDRKGSVVLIGRSFEEDLNFVQIEPDPLSGNRVYSIKNRGDATGAQKSFPSVQKTEEIHKALLLGLRDYVEKNGFKKVVIGLSGGIDSALAAAIAVDALGRERVAGISMPSRYSSSETKRDAAITAKNLNIDFKTIPIEKIFKAFMGTLAPVFKGLKKNSAEENLQSRIRGAVLMALSNKFGYLVLTTGNKSEVSVGYCTLYGDTAGGFALLKDLPKEWVYDLARFINRKAGRNIIPRTIIARAPTAELKFHQKDQDTLPPYPLLDKIIKLYVEEDRGYGDLLRRGFGREVLTKVIRMIDGNEYKRRQSPPGIKMTPKSFGKDRRMPITNGFFRHI